MIPLHKIFLMRIAYAGPFAVVPPPNRTGSAGGVGLDLLREFIQFNNGKLEIFSHNGYTLIDGSSDIVNNRASFFQGTLANITLKCDESFYHFSDELSQGPYF